MSKGKFPEIKITTAWDYLLDESPPANTHSEELGTAVSPYMKDKALTGMSGLTLVHELFTLAECKRLIEAAEDYGFGYTPYEKAYRGNTRLITVDASLASAMWERLKHIVPARIRVSNDRQGGQDEQREDDYDEWEAVGLNDNFRLAKYQNGDKFGIHIDSTYRKNYDERSMYTLNVYLNGNYTGGATRFFQRKDDSDTAADFSVQGVAGMCCIFRQPPAAVLLHDGEEVTSGVKYLLRSDIMYRRHIKPVMNKEVE